MRKIGSLILGVLALSGLAKADNSFSEIDLTSFQDIPSIIDACDVPIENVSCSTKPNCRRFYITGLWGPSAATVDRVGPNAFNTSATIFTAGIAGGVSLERERGRLRLEAEWLQRDFFRGDVSSFPGSPPDASVVAVENWSVLANVWRDFMVTEKFGCYGGGGIGGGGITSFGEIARVPATDSFTSSAFAWQAGGGLLYELTDQVTFDISYRWYQVNKLSGPSFGTNNDFKFAASQVMFSLRMFEPFRSLLR